MTQLALPIPLPVSAVLRPAPDHRPPGHTLPSLVAAQTRTSVGEATVARPDARRVRRSLVALPGGVRPDPSLPVAQEWAAMLTVAVLQVVAGRRPMDQLERWLDDQAVDQVRRAVAARRRSRSGPLGPTEVVSVRVQCSAPRAVEVAAHVRVGTTSAAVALRLEGVGERWRCSAIELGPMQPSPSAAAA